MFQLQPQTRLFQPSLLASLAAERFISNVGRNRTRLPGICDARYTGRMQEKYIQVVTTAEHREDVERIARTLVERRLAACVQIVGPISSIYRWRGAIETAQEWQCWIKSRGSLFVQIEQTIRGLHPYEVPEILALPILTGNADYLAWLEQETEATKD